MAAALYVCCGATNAPGDSSLMTKHSFTMLTSHVQFGKVVTSDGSYQRINERNPYYQAALDAVKASISASKV